MKNMLGNKKENGKATKCTRAFSVVMVVAMVYLIGLGDEAKLLSGLAELNRQRR